MKKYPKIKRLDQEGEKIIGVDKLILLEKIDGANGRFKIKNNDIYFGTRRTKQTKNNQPLSIDKMNNSFVHAYKYLQKIIEWENVEKLDFPFEKATFFGECLHKHTLDYTWSGNHPDIEGSNIPNFLCFDIYIEDKGFLRHEKVEEICSKIGIPTVPVIDICSYESMLDNYKVDEDKPLSSDNFDYPKSKFRQRDREADIEFDREAYPEGVVVKNDITKEKIKIVHPEFKETHKPSSSGQKNISEERKKANEFCNKYVTRQRIQKIAYKIRDESNKFEELEMSMMKKLPLRVIEDVFEEEDVNIDRENEDIMSEVRSKASSKCSTTLTRMINN